MGFLFATVLALTPQASHSQACSENFISSYNKLTQSIEFYNFSVYMVSETNPQVISKVIGQKVRDVLKNCEEFFLNHSRVICAANIEDEVVLVNSEGFRPECEQAQNLFDQEAGKPPKADEKAAKKNGVKAKSRTFKI